MGGRGIIIRPEGHCSYKDCLNPAVFVIFCSAVPLTNDGMLCFIPCVDHITRANRDMIKHLANTSIVALDAKQEAERFTAQMPGDN